jgi:alpha-L-fucosidase-like protein
MLHMNATKKIGEESAMNRRTFHRVLAGAAALRTFRGEEPGQFRATWESIRTHTVPAWYNNAKLGIFIHWGLYSVPAWAPPSGELGKVDMSRWFYDYAYAEWYLNSLRLKGSPTYKHHIETYGVLRGRGNYFRTGTCSREFLNIDVLCISDWCVGCIGVAGSDRRGGASGPANSFGLWVCIDCAGPYLHSLMSKTPPIDNLAPLAKAGVPILHDCGSLDPWLKDQTQVAEKRYRELGGKITVLVTEGEVTSRCRARIRNRWWISS